MDRLGAQGREIDERLDRIRRGSDKLQGSLRSTGTRGTAAFDKMRKATHRQNRSLTKADDRTDRLRRSTNRLNSSYGNLGSTIRRVTGLLGGMFLIDRAARFGRQIIGLGADMESTQISFETFLGSQSRAIDLIDKINSYANATPFANSTLQEGASLLLSFGIAGEEIMPTLQMLGDISGGNQQKFESLSLAFAQMRSTGRLMGQDLLQMINAGFNPLQVISERTGRSMADLQSDMEKGAISADMVTGAFRAATSEGGRFFNMMQKQSQTTNGLISTLRGKFSLMLAEIGRGGESITKGALKRMIQWLDANRTRIMAFFQRIQQGIVNLGQWIGRVVTLMRPYVMRIIEGFRGLWSAIVSLISKVTDLSSGTNTLNGILNVATGIITGVIGVATWLVEVLEANWKWLKYVAMGVGAVIVVTKAWKIAQLALNVALSANPIGIIITLIAGLVAAIVWAWDNMEGFRGAIMGIWAAAKQVFTNLAKLVINFVDSTFRPFLESFNHMKEGNIGQALLSLGEGVFNVSMVPARLMTGIFTGMSKLGEGVGDAFASGFDEGVAQVRESKMQEQLRKAEEAQGKLGQNTNPGQGETNPPGMDTPGELEQGMQAITGGGARATHINISLNDLVGELNLYPANVEQGMDEITDVILDRLLRVLNSANQIATK